MEALDKEMVEITYAKTSVRPFFFKRRSDNDASESFNAKIKAFKIQLRGGRYIETREYLYIKLNSLRISV